jgi:hypothetical protein
MLLRFRYAKYEFSGHVHTDLSLLGCDVVYLVYLYPGHIPHDRLPPYISGSWFLRNVDKDLPVCMVSHPRKQKSSVNQCTIFSDITPCSFLKTSRRFGGTYGLHLQGRISRARELATCFHAVILLGLFFDTEDGDDMFLRNVGWLLTDYTALCPRR